MRTQRVPDGGTTAIVSFSVVVLIYAVAFTAFLSVVEQPVHGSRDGPSLGVTADSAMVDLLDTSGYYVDGATKAKGWTTAPDRITRFGLAQEGQPGVLDLAKMRNLSKGGVEVLGTNNLLDYEEARGALGVGDYDFHLRTYPVFDALADAGPRPIKGIDVAYVGDYTSTPGGPQSNYPVQNLTTVEDRGVHVYVNVTVTNNGTTASMFKVEFDVPTDETSEDDQFTPVLAPGQSHKVTLKLHKQAAWAWDGADRDVKITIKDPTKNVGSIHASLSGITMTSPAYGQAGKAFITSIPEKWSYKTNQKPKVTYEVWEPDGDPESGNPTVNITVRNGAGTIVDQWEGSGGASQKYQLCCNLPAGVYTVTIYRPSDPAFNATSTIVVTDGSEGSFSSDAPPTITESYASAYERGLLGSLVDGWTNATFQAGGDVYRDLSNDLNNDLAENLTAGAYDILVMGSNANQNAMTDAAAKDAVKEFVRNGGLLVVLGSAEQDVGWLEPLFASSLTTSGSGIGAPDDANPILHAPEELAWRSYPDNGRTWRYDSDTDASHFNHVVVRDGAQRDDILGVSKPGHFGNGTIILTGWTPYSLTSPQSFLEAQKVLYNFLLRSLGSLYADFGPQIPRFAEVASSSRMATAPHPQIPGDEVLVRVILYVFR